MDGRRALELVEAQVAFGPRVPGSAGHAAALAWLEERLGAAGAVVQRRPFRATSPLSGEEIEGANVIASFRPEAKERVFFGAHWDSRATADRDPDPQKRRRPVPGANDGGSGVAVLVALAEILGEVVPPIGVDLLFFDAEDQGVAEEPETFCIGSRIFAAAAPVTGFSPRFGVVFDLVGHRDLTVCRDAGSIERFPATAEAIYRLAERVAPNRFDRTATRGSYDDHIPFLDAGIPAILVAGFGYPEWHTTADLPGICSAASLADIGRLAVEIVYGGHEIP